MLRGLRAPAAGATTGVITRRPKTVTPAVQEWLFLSVRSCIRSAAGQAAQAARLIQKPRSFLSGQRRGAFITSTASPSGSVAAAIGSPRSPGGRFSGGRFCFGSWKCNARSAGMSGSRAGPAHFVFSWRKNA